VSRSPLEFHSSGLEGDRTLKTMIRACFYSTTWCEGLLEGSVFVTVPKQLANMKVLGQRLPARQSADGQPSSTRCRRSAVEGGACASVGCSWKKIERLGRKNSKETEEEIRTTGQQ
jgi:hypothetical protein